MAYTNEALGKALEDLTVAYNNFITKAKETAIAAISDTVIKQIKQDARDYIASELAAQKDTLEKAIEMAKIAIHNSAIEAETSLKQASEAKKKELASLITAAENVLKEKAAKTVQAINTTAKEELVRLQKVKEDAKKEINKIKETIATECEKKSKTYTDTLLIKVFQNGYIQWPWMPKPETVFSFKGYRWAEVNYDGCFFRAKGKGANPFNGEEQSDAIRNITGSFGTQGNDKSDTADGAFYPKKRGRTDGGYSEGTNWLNEVGLDLTKIKGFPTASENRSRNRTFIIWQLKKI